MTFFSNATDNGTAPAGAASIKAKTSEIGIFQSVNSVKMNMLIEKTTDKYLIVVLKDSKSEILITERVAKKRNAIMLNIGCTNS
jgi:hypothetical protein